VRTRRSGPFPWLSSPRGTRSAPIAATVITVGIDLAAQDKDTAACQIEWSGGEASVSVPELGLSDDALVDRVTSRDRVGIDASFGWPDEFA
jgi:hypothetical protein